MNFLLDTNVISELTKRQPSPKVSQWYDSTPAAQLYLSVITLGEIRKGVELKRAVSSLAARRFEAWLTQLTAAYQPRILDFDEASADEWGRLMALDRNLPAEDGQLAATAIRHNLTLVTRNVRHLPSGRVSVLNPF